MKDWCYRVPSIPNANSRPTKRPTEIRLTKSQGFGIAHDGQTRISVLLLVIDVNNRASRGFFIR